MQLPASVICFFGADSRFYLVPCTAWLHAAADYWIAVVGKEKRCDGNHGAVGMDLLSVVGHSSV